MKDADVDLALSEIAAVSSTSILRPDFQLMGRYSQTLRLPGYGALGTSITPLTTSGASTSKC